MKKKNSSKTASCLCGGIKINVRGKLRNVSNCHCSQCMKTHGNFAAYTACPEENITFINKKSLKWFNHLILLKEAFALLVVQVYFIRKLKVTKLALQLECLNILQNLKLCLIFLLKVS